MYVAKRGPLLRKFTAVLFIILGIAIIGGGSFFTFRHLNTSDDQDNTSHQNSPMRATITFDGDSFEPEITSIAQGGTLKIVNQSTKDLSFNSDEHPQHTDNSELNVGTVDAGVSKSVILRTVGTWGFHNHFNSEQHGQITVD